MRNRQTDRSESLRAIMASWGSLLASSFGIAPRTAAARRQAARVRVLGPAPDQDQVLIGELTNDAGEYVFRYDRDYAGRPDYPALLAFPDKDREYRSRELWPFFGVRLPPLDRADIRHLIRERKIDEGDTLRLLTELGRRTVTTPYELHYGSAR